MAYLLTLLSSLSKIFVRVGTFIIVAPILGPEDQAVLAVSSAWGLVLGLIVVFGLPVRVLREVALAPDRAPVTFIEDIRLMTVLLPVSVVGAVLLDFAYVREVDRFCFYLIFASTICTVYGDYCAAMLRSLGSYLTEAKISFSTGVLHFVLIAVSAVYWRNVDVVAVAILFSRLVFGGVSVYCVRSALKSRAHCNESVKSVFSVFCASWRYAIDAFLATAYSQCDILILDQFADRKMVGLYSAGSRFVGLFLAVPSILQNVVIPRLTTARMRGDFTSRLREFSLVMSAGALISILSIVFGGTLVVSQYLGYQYSSLNEYWVFFALMVVARFFESFYGILLYVYGDISGRVFRLSFGLLLMMLGGGLAAMYLAIDSFILVMTGVYFIMALSSSMKVSSISRG